LGSWPSKFPNLLILEEVTLHRNSQLKKSPSPYMPKMPSRAFPQKNASFWNLKARASCIKSRLEILGMYAGFSAFEFVVPSY
ncbi:hypothetical protein WUBG_14611, partial [Wuchereria bancrofti]